MLADLYVGSLAVGAIGLAVMAVGGLAHVGHHGQSGAAAGHAGHVGHAAGGARGTLAGRAGGRAGHAARGQGARGGRAGGGIQGFLSQAFWTATSPRLLFSLLIGFGTAGLLLQPLLGGAVLAAASVGGAVLFERLVVTPIWNLTLRFASEPASTLEASIADEATAVTSFDANGQGIVALEVDGQVVQVLGTLQSADRELGVRVRAGERVRIEDVDAARNRCTVSRA